MVEVLRGSHALCQTPPDVCSNMCVHNVVDHLIVRPQLNAFSEANMNACCSPWYGFRALASHTITEAKLGSIGWTSVPPEAPKSEHRPLLEHALECLRFMPGAHSFSLCCASVLGRAIYFDIASTFTVIDWTVSTTSEFAMYPPPMSTQSDLRSSSSLDDKPRLPPVRACGHT